jgi:hypothetical protein
MEGRERRLRKVAMRRAGRKGREVGGRPAWGAMRRITDQVSGRWNAKGASMTREPRPMVKRSQESVGEDSRDASALPQCHAVSARKKSVEGRG